MDIGGFLYTYKHVDADTDIILKIHTKKGLGDTINPSNSLKRYGIDKAKKIGEGWFKNLMGGVLKNKNQVNNIINEFTLNPKCGMVGFKLNNNYDINHKEMEKIYDLINVHPTGKNPFFVVSVGKKTKRKEGTAMEHYRLRGQEDNCLVWRTNRPAHFPYWDP